MLAQHWRSHHIPLTFGDDNDRMKLTGIIATCTTAAVLATAGVSVASASSGSGAPASTAATTKAHPEAVRRAALAGLKVSAHTIGISPAALAAELRTGKS